MFQPHLPFGTYPPTKTTGNTGLSTQQLTPSSVVARGASNAPASKSNLCAKQSQDRIAVPPYRYTSCVEPTIRSSAVCLRYRTARPILGIRNYEDTTHWRSFHPRPPYLMVPSALGMEFNGSIGMEKNKLPGSSLVSRTVTLEDITCSPQTRIGNLRLRCQIRDKILTQVAWYRRL